ncbi:NUDIX domain-containing protein [Pseudoxanthomonas sp.]|uniref:NUDIX domain-containing protein n=1 Tax=Pseudoxanthomonas sp. TaxID=1871049 RepID=UPI002E14A40E|nr:NUDIX domain-containing protein [Pseudoxanthomonas sp.]
MSEDIVNERGERLLSIIASDPAVLPAFALVIATLDDNVMLVHNPRRAAWELPGGFVDAGETADACACRELREESGQGSADLDSVADILIGLPDGTVRHGRVFRGTLTRWRPFVPNLEADDCRTWHASDLPAQTSAIDAYLVRHLTSQPA